MMNAIDKLPETIRVHGFDIRIEKWPVNAARASIRLGEFSAVEQLIRVDISLPTPQRAVDTFLHEICHAIYWAYDIDEKDDEERTVSVMGAAWMQIYRDNPWLLQWIGDALHPIKHAPERNDLYDRIKKANEWFDSLTPEQQAAHREEQARGEMALDRKPVATSRLGK